MTKPKPTRPVCFILGAYVLGVVLCLMISDKLIVKLMENLRTINLSAEANGDQASLDVEIRTLEQQVEQMAATITQLKARRLPSLQEVKDLQRTHRLDLIQMERVSTPRTDASGTLEYNTVLTGTIGGLVRFLRDLESNHIVKSEQVVLRPANEDSSTVALTLSLSVREE